MKSDASDMPPDESGTSTGLGHKVKTALQRVAAEDMEDTAGLAPPNPAHGVLEAGDQPRSGEFPSREVRAAIVGLWSWALGLHLITKLVIRPGGGRPGAAVHRLHRAVERKEPVVLPPARRAHQRESCGRCPKLRPRKNQNLRRRAGSGAKRNGANEALKPRLCVSPKRNKDAC